MLQSQLHHHADQLAYNYYKAPMVHQWNLSFAETTAGLDGAGAELRRQQRLWQLGQLSGQSAADSRARRRRHPPAATPRTPLAPITDVRTLGPQPLRGHDRASGKALDPRALFSGELHLRPRHRPEFRRGAGRLRLLRHPGRRPEPYNLSAQRGPSDSNVPRRFVFSATWDLPFGNGQRYLPHGLRSLHLGRLAGQRHLDRAGRFSPSPLALSVDNANIGDYLLAQPHLRRPASESDGTELVRPELFPHAAAVYLRQRRAAMCSMARARTTWISPCTASSPFPCAKSMKLEFRGEFFNFFNHRIRHARGIARPAATGQITTTSIPNRQVQFALKLMWWECPSAPEARSHRRRSGHGRGRRPPNSRRFWNDSSNTPCTQRLAASASGDTHTTAMGNAYPGLLCVNTNGLTGVYYTGLSDLREVCRRSRCGNRGLSARDNEYTVEPTWGNGQRCDFCCRMRNICAHPRNSPSVGSVLFTWKYYRLP